MLEYRSVVHGPAPWSENLGRRVQQTLGGLGDWAEAGTYVIPLGRVGLFAARGTGIVASNGTRIIGFTRHGVDRAIGDAAKRAGTRPQAILDALKNPTREIVEGIDKLGRPFQIFRGADARVIVNPQTGLIVSTNPLSALGAL